MSTILEHLLRAHLEAGGFAMLMSATLGSTACRWLGQENLPPLVEAIDKTPYPAVSTPERITTAGENGHAKTITIAARGMMSDFSDTPRHALQAARAGAKVLVIRNTVGYAVETHQALEALAGHEDGELLLRVKGVTRLHHGRFAAVDRRLLDGAVEDALGENRGTGG